MLERQHRFHAAVALVLALAANACGSDHENLKDPVPNTGGAGGGDAGGPCVSNAECDAPGLPVCDPGTHACVACMTQADCDDGYTCEDRSCIPIESCESSLDCPIGQVCDTASKRCVECLTDADCGGARCVGQACRVACDSDNDCTQQGQLCNKIAGYCVDCFDDTLCAPHEHCATGLCKTDVCTEGSAACEGNAIVACNDSGSGYDAPSPCAPQQSCSASGGTPSCEDWICTPEMVFCTSAEQAVRCAADGLTQTVLSDCGAAGEVCVAGDCAEVVCTPGARFCSNDTVLQCSAKGDTSAVYATCTSAQYCDESTATCMAKVCSPNEPVCTGNVATTCNAQGSGFVPGGIDCSSSQQLCSSGTCKTQVCDPDSEYCDAGAVRRCASDGLSSAIVQTCGATQYCDAATASCQAQSCVPGAPGCNGSVATTCNAEGSGYVPGGVNCSTAGQVCHAGACVAMVCTPGAHYCEGGDVRACSSDGLSSSVYDDCTSTEFCDDAWASCKPQICAPGQPACNGNTATTCNALGSGYVAGGVNCATSGQLCHAGACATMVCTPGSHFCEGGDVRVCSSDGLTSSVYDDCSSAEYCDVATATCRAQICTPGQPACDGNTARTCNAMGSGYEAGGVDCGLQHCLGGACVDALFVEDFEDGNDDGWTLMSSNHTHVVSSTVGADGTGHSLTMTKAIGSGVSHEEGLARTISNLQPQSVSWWSRASQVDKSTTYFVLQSDAAGTNRLVSFYFRSTGMLRLYIDTSTFYDVPYVANQWYHMELRDIDWSARTYDYYVDGVLVQANVPLLGTGMSIGHIDLYHYDEAASGYWDEIVFE